MTGMDVTRSKPFAARLFRISWSFKWSLGDGSSCRGSRGKRRRVLVLAGEPLLLLFARFRTVCNPRLLIGSQFHVLVFDAGLKRLKVQFHDVEAAPLDVVQGKAELEV